MGPEDYCGLAQSRKGRERQSKNMQFISRVSIDLLRYLETPSTRLDTTSSKEEGPEANLSLLYPHLRPRCPLPIPSPHARPK
jgi:hypothetical protein